MPYKNNWLLLTYSEDSTDPPLIRPVFIECCLHTQLFLHKHVVRKLNRSTFLKVD